jgi:Ca2+-binding EF-hand superfamily protein
LEQFGLDATEREVDLIFCIFDKDHDGRISRKEFEEELTFYKEEYKGREEPIVRATT